MSLKVRAIYEKGVFHPLTPLELPERSQVEIDVQQVELPGNKTSHRDHVRQALVATGVSLPASDAHSHESTALTAERRGELARLFAADQALSELISEDREGR